MRHLCIIFIANPTCELHMRLNEANRLRVVLRIKSHGLSSQQPTTYPRIAFYE